MNGTYLEFEKPIAEIEIKIQEMRDLSVNGGLQLDNEILILERKLEKVQREVYSKLSRWQRVLLARHPKRPQSLDYINLMTTDFLELHGDRGFADDKAIVGGVAKLDDRPIVVIGQQKGKDTKQKLRNNFGMSHPEGYRKALRIMQLAAKFRLPILILIDTPGAYPGVGAEERGQAEAIARNLREMSVLPVPIVIVIIGEGASGGALGIGIGDRVYMLENSWYSVISPEGCAAILWRDSGKAPQAAEALKPAASDLLELGVIDKVIPEPGGSAHRQPAEQARIIRECVVKAFEELLTLPTSQLVANRINKFRVMGQFIEVLSQ
ncbi:MAG: acetyl-CoA carboxylase carboxyltransferase subunit alpha [candidate division Zixibacteria bacterium RBG_16_48_11]|nr:MAG: acetyl-CoA carboxylase carboxyltransferase subunit alpha [candidate division Zixibacteria bacterium RBG_16_48_11]